MKTYALPHPILESTFNDLRQSQIKDKKKLIDLLCEINLLPNELWIYIVSFLQNDLYEANLMFLRRNIGLQDTYYFFRGTKSNFDESMSKMKKEVLEIQEISRAIDDDLLDTPIDTYCRCDLHIDNECNSDGKCFNNINKCCSQWEYYVYDNAEELYTDYKDRIKTAKKEAYYKSCEIKFI